MTDYFELTFEVPIPEPIRLATPDGETVAVLPVPTRRVQRAIDEAKTFGELRRACLGEQYDTVEEYFDELPRQRWNEFWEQYDAHFFGPGAAESPGKSPDSSDSSGSTTTTSNTTSESSTG